MGGAALRGQAQDRAAAVVGVGAAGDQAAGDQPDRQLVYHVFNIPEVFLDHVENDAPYTYEALKSILPADLVTRSDLLAHGAAVRGRFAEWWARDGAATDFTQPGNVYYGEVTLHEVLERTTWHPCQHTLQLMALLERLDIDPDGPLSPADRAGLPLPDKVWDA